MEINGYKEKIKNNLIPIVFGGAGIVLILVAVIILSKKETPQEKYQDVTDQKFANCETKKQKYVIDGGTDLFPPGTEVEVDLNYYACNKGQREDIVMVKTPGREQPLIKMIKMIPGDKYKVVQEQDKKYRIVVNGDEIENSKGEEYALSERKMRMIKLYETNFKDGIKDDVYFVFGDSTAGGFDSTRFGPIMPERMVGKVLTKLGEGSKPEVVEAKSEGKKETGTAEETKEASKTVEKPKPQAAKPATKTVAASKNTKPVPAKPGVIPPVKPAATKQ